MQQDFLVEIGTEELPPKALRKLRDAFAAELEVGLQANDLNFDEVKSYAAPRRLAIWIKNLATTQPDKVVERRGPAKAAAFDAEGNPSKALQGFAKSCGIEVADLQEIETEKGVWMAFNQEVKGKSTLELIPDLVAQALAKLPIPKRMRWGSSDVEFVRPVHWVLMLLGEQIVPATILGKTAGNQTFGHRFHAPEAIEINKADEYAEKLASQGFVLADFEQRKEKIRTQLLAAAKENNAEVVIDEALLDEVTALNEWPSAIVGSFDQEFLQVAPECLISAMKGHQKYFHLLDSNQKLLAKFITISNIESSRPESVVEGNERVIRPRLSDAKFFWEQDLKQPLDSFLPRLETVVFQQKLGSLAAKVARVEKLAVLIGEQLNAEPDLVARAARLSKSDLMSLMVGEFPELQGVMGRYYATAQNENPQVAEAIDQQYQPRFAGDALPQQPIAQALAIADKLDTICGIYGIGEVPTGDKDPFALRRAALGVLRIMIENNLALDLKQLIEASLQIHSEDHGAIDAQPDLVADLYEFIINRLKAYYADKRVSPQTFEAVKSAEPAPSKPADFAKRIDAVSHFVEMEAAETLAAAHKRIQNILRKLEGEWPTSVSGNLLQEPAEKQLAAAIDQVSAAAFEQINAQNYIAAFNTLAQLRAPVDEFFDQVMVMADDEQVRNNRLALLNNIYKLFAQIADISHL